jgi:hypothetical protein
MGPVDANAGNEINVQVRAAEYRIIWLEMSLLHSLYFGSLLRTGRGEG